MFVGTAPYVAAEGYGAGADVYGVGFVTVAAGYMTSNLVYARLAGRVGGEVLMTVGLAAAVIGPGLCAIAMALGWRGIETVFAPAVLLSLCSGLVVPNAMAGAVSACPERAGSASSLLGFTQFLVAACATQLGASLPHDSALAMSVAMAGTSAVGLVGFFALRAAGSRLAH
jgi:DHA1 family bicyclomycin/chloramphenicol resistance-like MFS transporter